MEVTGTKIEILSFQLSWRPFYCIYFLMMQIHFTFGRFLLVAIVVYSKIFMTKEHFKYSYHYCITLFSESDVLSIANLKFEQNF